MCLIIHKPADALFDLDIVKDAAMMHSDGFGIMWVENGKVNAYKSADMTLLENVVSSVNEMTDFEAGLHLRYATHGSVRDGNCHPFLSKNSKYGLMHNGVISVERKGDETDSNAFCRTVAFPALRKHDLMSAADLIEKSHGSNNRTLIATASGKFVRTGNWISRNGLNYSNGSGFYSYYKPTVTVSETAYTKPYFIEDFEGWSESRIAAYIRKNPAEVAEMISDHLARTSYESGNFRF